MPVGQPITPDVIDRWPSRGWHNSSAYREILALRTDNSQADVVIAVGVRHPHKATDVLG